MDQTSPAWRAQVQPIPDFLKTTGGAATPSGPSGAPPSQSTPMGQIPQQHISFQKHSFVLMLLGMSVLIILSFLVGFLLGAKAFLPHPPHQAAPQAAGQAAGQTAGLLNGVPHIHIPSETTLSNWGITEPAALTSLENKLPSGADDFLKHELDHARHNWNHASPHAAPHTASTVTPPTPPMAHPAMIIPSAAPSPAIPGQPVGLPNIYPDAQPPAPYAPQAAALGQGATPAPAQATYTLQVGAFNNADKAIQTASMYNQQGHPAYVVKSWGDKGRLWYFVRMGQFKNAHDANTQAMNMVKNYHMSAMVVEQKPGDIRL